MTLHDLWKLLQRFSKPLIIVPLACALVAGVGTWLLPSDYQATAVVAATGEAGAAGGIAETQAAAKSGNGIVVSAETDATAKRITLTAKGASPEACVSAANDAAQATADAAKSSFAQQKYTVTQASNARDLSQNPLKMALVALFGGLFVAVCVVVAWDMIRRPVKSKEDAAQGAQAPVLGQVPSDDGGERLLANVRFASPQQLETLCIIPASDPQVGVSIANELLRAAGNAGVRATAVRAEAHAEYLNANPAQTGMLIVVCAPLSEGMGAAYLSRAADVTLLAVREWVDSQILVEQIVSDLYLADVQLDGVVVAPEDATQLNVQRGPRRELGQPGRESGRGGMNMGGRRGGRGRHGGR